MLTNKEITIVYFYANGKSWVSTYNTPYNENFINGIKSIPTAHYDTGHPEDANWTCEAKYGPIVEAMIRVYFCDLPHRFIIRRLEQTVIEEKTLKKENISAQESNDPIIDKLTDEIQTLTNKQLSPVELKHLRILYYDCGLPYEVISLLLNYLASIGRANVRDLTRFGVRWKDEGVKTVNDAKNQIMKMTAKREAWKKITSILCIDNTNNPTRAQIENADRWLNTWEFSDEMIIEAYERCVKIKGDYNISYINAILKRWHEKGIKSLDELLLRESSKS